MSVYRTDSGRDTLLSCYDAALDDLSLDVSERTVSTRHGDTHLLCAGPDAAPPVLVVHGANATNPMTLSWVAGLADDYRLIAPDVIGQPGYSATTRPDPRGDAFGEWIVDLFDAVGVTSAPAIGVSYGAGILLRTAAVAPDRLDRAALVVPAGFGTGSMVGMASLGASSLTYCFSGNGFALDHALGRLMTDPDGDPIARETVAASLRHVNLETRFPEATAADIAGFDAPVALFLASEDPFFPPSSVASRARERLTNLVGVTTLDGESHILSAAARERVCREIAAFVDG
ncbi:alpha/beta fold hydrolase [Halococcoides cellulosivorans]|uniref:Alpha/beta hydrolase n=1 Tax=Halococcoides cellulosivorans TaxID=1679096 RepID=A0A2R4X407_9EURY|nr:alpha/beta fold hydrolase [Halococcoides cellulosivorans]AWB28532.1 alpha/beta hydrolase [Halococcoides cellulosivorans]